MNVWGIAIDDDILGFGYPSSESCPVGSSTMSRPGTRDRVDAPAEGEEGDRQTMDENRAEDDESDDRLDGLCQELGLGLRITSFGVWQLVNGKCGDEYGTYGGLVSEQDKTLSKVMNAPTPIGPK